MLTKPKHKQILMYYIYYYCQTVEDASMYHNACVGLSLTHGNYH